MAQSLDHITVTVKTVSYVINAARAAKTEDPSHAQRLVYLSVSRSLISTMIFSHHTDPRSLEGQTRRLHSCIPGRSTPSSS